MQIKAETALNTGDLLCLRTARDGNRVLGHWQLGDDAIGIAARPLPAGAMVEYTPGKSSGDILVKGSQGPTQGTVIRLKTATSLQEEDLVCLRQPDGGSTVLDKWQFGDEAVGIAARNIAENEEVEFCPVVSTNDIHVRPTRTPTRSS
jgi:hypothetical protein